MILLTLEEKLGEIELVDLETGGFFYREIVYTSPMTEGNNLSKRTHTFKAYHQRHPKADTPMQIVANHTNHDLSNLY